MILVAAQLGFWAHYPIAQAKRMVYDRIVWSIGIFEGDSPTHFSGQNLSNPVLTAANVWDVPAAFVADPFIVREGEKWYMFMEVFNKRSDQGDIAYAESADGLRWQYRRVIVDEPFHMSYPCVFKDGSDYYMIPETAEAYGIRLYKAASFPEGWTYVKTLIPGDYVDSSIFKFEDRWWMFTTDKTVNKRGEDLNNNLRLFYADNLMGPWYEHRQSPLITGNAHISRGGGRVLVLKDGVIRYTQDCAGYYGSKIRAFFITRLTTEEFAEEPIDGEILTGTDQRGWNSRGMHQVDAQRLPNGRWLTCVDGQASERTFELNFMKFHYKIRLK